MNSQEFVQVGGSWYLADDVIDAVAWAIRALSNKIYDLDRERERRRPSSLVNVHRARPTMRADVRRGGSFVAWAGGKKFTDAAEFNRFLDSGKPLWDGRSDTERTMTALGKMQPRKLERNGVRPVGWAQLRKELRADQAVKMRALARHEHSVAMRAGRR